MRWQWQNLKLALPNSRVSEERELRDVLWREHNLKLVFLFSFFLGSNSKGSREPWETVWSRFSEPWGPSAVRTGPYFFPIEQFLRLKEQQKWAVWGFPGRTVQSSPSLKTLINWGLSTDVCPISIFWLAIDLPFLDFLTISSMVSCNNLHFY